MRGNEKIAFEFTNIQVELLEGNKNIDKVNRALLGHIEIYQEIIYNLLKQDDKDTGRFKKVINKHIN